MVKLYNDSKAKRFIQNLIFQSVNGISSNALVLAGPSPNLYLEKIAKYVAQKKDNQIISYENDWKSYIEQIDSVKTLDKNVKKKAIFNFSNISNAEPQRFIDLDLKCTIIHGKELIKDLFLKQFVKYKDPEEKKVFVFTLSYMYRSITEIFPFLENLLKTKIIIFDEVKMDHGTEIQIISSNKKYIVRVFSYSDTSTMFTVLIKY